MLDEKQEKTLNSQVEVSVRTREEIADIPQRWAGQKCEAASLSWEVRGRVLLIKSLCDENIEGSGEQKEKLQCGA